MAKRTYLRWPNNLLLRLTFMPPGPLTSGCVEYTGALDSDGYGRQITRGSTADRAQPHVAAYELLVGPVPDGHELDHLCRNKVCCNPSHLRLLTNVDNATDNTQGSKTECPRGHPYNEENTYMTPKGHRRCRPCARQVKREWHAKTKGMT